MSEPEIDPAALEIARENCSCRGVPPCPACVSESLSIMAYAAEREAKLQKWNHDLWKEVRALKAGFNRRTPAVGEVRKCLVCALEKPWGVYDEITGAAVCVSCRDARHEVSKLREERDAALALAEERAALLTTECALASRYMAERDAAIKAREAAEQDATAYRLAAEAAGDQVSEDQRIVDQLTERAEKAEAALRELQTPRAQLGPTDPGTRSSVNPEPKEPTR